MTYRKLGVLAGGGALPVAIVDACRQSKKPYHILPIEGSADKAWLAEHPHDWIQFGTMKRTLGILNTQGCDAIVMIGNVGRPNFRSLKVDLLGARLLPKVIAASRAGDDALLRCLVEQFEKFGLKVLGADDIVESLVVREECLTKTHPSEVNRADIEKALEIARVIGNLDIGQGAIVCRGVVLAVEAAEGTDKMLERCAALPPNIRGSITERDGVLVKAKKPKQEHRTDLPVLGVETIERASRAGLAGIAIEANNALILERESVIDRANQLGLFVIGVGDSQK